MQIRVHPRIEMRHSELKPSDVLEAWENWIMQGTRMASKDNPRILRIGYDRQSREIEMIGVQTEYGWLIFHAMTPPSKKTKAELERTRRRAK